MSDAQSIIGDEVRIPAGPVALSADLVVPPQAIGLVLFAHGSGSSRHSPRNRYVAGELNDGRIATLLADLLTEQEEADDMAGSRLRFDIDLLTSRLVQIADWLQTTDATANLPLGLFGASTGAAAALDTAAMRPEVVRAVVSRGGRPDLATRLEGVRAPTMLIVGGNDPTVIGLNQQALRALTCIKRLDVVRGATHLFEEPGCLEEVASLARRWFTKFLS
jgi:putative phosphoribosyl transferase